MTNISDPNATEMRGWVMLMLERAAETVNPSECNDPAVLLACSLGSDSCPAACQKDGETEVDDKGNVVVRSGDLSVTAAAAAGKKVIVPSSISDLDTLTFKTSEEVELSKVVLERYGYSSNTDVANVWLEDEAGNVITNKASLNTKGQANLTIKKDYRKVDGTYNATIVLETSSTAVSGKTIGFKVVSVDSTAKNLNLDNYDPYLYDLVNYVGSKVEFTSRNSATKDYNWEAGELYEIAKFRVKAPADSSILVKGFTLTDKDGNKIETDKYAKDVKVTFDGESVDGLKWNINKDDELVISFSEVEIAGKETATIAVSMSFNEEFDNLNQTVAYHIEKTTNFNATDKKTGTRISAADGKDVTDMGIASANGWTRYTFKGGKIKISGTKLGTVNAAAGSSNVLVAQGEITVTEALRGSAVIGVKEQNNIDEIRLVISGEEYDGTKVLPATTAAPAYATNKAYFAGDLISKEGKVYKVTEDIAKDDNDGFAKVKTVDLGITAYKFTGLEIEKSGKVEIRVDLKDDADNTMSFASSLNSSLFDLKYDESGKTVGSQLIGSISVSDVKTQAAKADLSSKVSKEVELIKNETNRKTIFDGTYTAKKGAVTLKEFTITTDGAYGFNESDKVTFYVTVDGEEYDVDLDTTNVDITKYNARGDIDDIEVADGKSVDVKVEIEMVPSNTDANAYETFNIAFEGEDADNNKAGEADEDTVKVKVVNQGSLNVDSNAKNTVLLKSSKTLAEFRLKPSKAGDDDVILKSIKFNGVDDANMKVVVDGDTVKVSGTAGKYEPGISVPAEGVIVKVSLKSETAGEFTLNLVNVNESTTPVTATFKKYFVPATLSITQSKNGDTTKYVVDVENEDTNSVTDLYFYIDGTAGECTKAQADNLFLDPATAGNPDKIATAKTYCVEVAKKTGTLSETDNRLSAVNDEKARSITAIRYTVGANTYTILKSVYDDFFYAGSDDLMVYSNK